MALPRAGMLKAGAFAPDAESRARFAAGFWDKPTVDSAFAAGAVGTDKIVAVGNFDFGVHAAKSSFVPVANNDLANKAYVDAVAGGGGGGGWTDDGAVVRLTDINDQIGIGNATPDPTAKVEIDASAGGFIIGLTVRSGYLTAPSGGFASEAFGFGATANGDDSTSIGNGADDGGFQGCTIVGKSSVAPNDFATIVGSNSTGAFNSVTVGVSSAVGDNGVSVGSNIVNGGTNSIVVGQSAQSLGDGCVVIGPQAQGGTSGQTNVVVVGGSQADGTDIVVMGSAAVTGSNLVSIGTAIGSIFGSNTASTKVVAIGGQAFGAVAGRQFVLIGDRGNEGLQGDNIYAVGHWVGTEDTVFMSQILLGAGAIPLDQPMTFIAGSNMQPATDVWFGAGANSGGAVTTTIHGTRADTTTPMVAPVTPSVTLDPTAGGWAVGTYNFFATRFDGVGESAGSALGSFTITGTEAPILDNFDPGDGTNRACGMYVYIEDAPGSGVYRRAKPQTGVSDRYLVSALGPEIFNQQPTTEPTRNPADPSYVRDGNGGALNFAGGLGFDDTKTGGSLGFYTARTGSGDVLTLAGMFNASDGTLTVPGAGTDSERFGLNTVADGDGAVAIGARAAANGTTGCVAIGVDSAVSAASDYGIAVGPQTAVNSRFGGIAFGGFASAGFVTTGTPLDNQRHAENIAIGDSALSGGTDTIAIGDGLVAGASSDSDLNVYFDIVAIGDGCQAGDVSNGSTQVAATGDGVQTSFSGTLSGTPIWRVCVRWEYTIGGVTYVAQTGPTTSASTGTFGPHLGVPSNLNGNSGAFVLTFTTPPDNGTDIIARPNFGSRDLVVIGDGSVAQGSDCVAIGNGSQAGSDRTHTNIVAIGDGCFAAFSNTVALGNGSRPSAANQFVVGSHAPGGAGAITDVWFGGGPRHTDGQQGVTAHCTIHGTDGQEFGVRDGSDISLAGGRGYEAADHGGKVRIKIALDGTADTLTDAVIVDNVLGYVAIGSADPASRLDVQGTSGFKGINITTDTTLDNTSATDTTYLTLDGTAGNVTATLPPIATCVNRRYKAVRSDNVLANTVSVAGNGAETINGVANFLFTNQWDSAEFWNDGTQWFVF